MQCAHLAKENWNKRNKNENSLPSLNSSLWPHIMGDFSYLIHIPELSSQTNHACVSIDKLQLIDLTIILYGFKLHLMLLSELLQLKFVRNFLLLNLLMLSLHWMVLKCLWMQVEVIINYESLIFAIVLS